jgi:MFS family permease
MNPKPAFAPAPTRPASTREHRSFWAIAVTLMLLSVMSYLDRQIVALLVPDLRRELGLSDLQVGTLIGPAFMAPYLVALFAASLFVDRVDKVTVIVCGTTFWAIMTCASAFAQSYAELLVLRGGLAVGEAMLGPAATALIGEMFANDHRRRLTASSFFLMGSTIGASGSAAFGSLAIQIVSTVAISLPRVGVASDWRLALIAVSIPSVLLAVVLWGVGRPARRRSTARPPIVVGGGGQDLGTHLRERGWCYLLLFVSANLMVMAQVAALIWGPSYLMRNFLIDQVNAGYLFGLIALTGGVAGTLASTWVIRRWAAAGTASQFARIVFVAGGTGMVLLAAAMTAPSLGWCLSLLLVALGFTGVLVTIPMQYLQTVAPAHLKGRIAVGMYVILYFLTAGLGPLVPPAIAGMLEHGSGQLGRAIAWCAGGSLTLSCVLLLALIRISPSERIARSTGRHL